MKNITWFCFVMLFLGGCSRESQTIPIPVISPAPWAHTATRLQDGRILIVGGLVGTAGENEASVTESAWIIDPDTGDARATGSLLQKRFRHTATLLDDGRVLIAGGQSWDPFVIALDHVEIFDPAKNRFEPTSNPMISARHTHTATRLANGQVLLAGGDGPYMDMVLSDCEWFDPTSARFTSVPHMHSRTGHTATRLDSGHVLIAGGVNWSPLQYQGKVELFDSTALTFRLLKAIYPIPASYCDCAQKLLSGKVLLLNMSPSEAVLFDPISEKFEKTGTLNNSRIGATCTLLEDSGVVLVVGGYVPNSAFSPILQMEKYDPATGIFVACGDLLQPRFEHSATLLADNRVLLVGGIGPDKKPIEKCEFVQIK